MATNNRRRSAFASAEARKLWRETKRSYELAAHELLILRGACMALDKISLIADELDGADLTVTGSMGQDVANPLLGEQRAQQAAFDRAMKQLDLPDVDEGAQGPAAAKRSTSARDAAAARWSA